MNTQTKTAKAATGPHSRQPILTAGDPIEKASAALVLVHGRGASAEGMLGLYEDLNVKGLSVLAPQAAGSTWYPYSFLAPMETNQPYLDSALGKIETIVEDLLARGIRSEKIAILGFSQGACLTSEFLARHPRRYGAGLILTGGLIGPAGTARDYPGNFAGTPVFLGTSDPDPHVPFERALETQQVLTRMGAKLDLRRYPGMPHAINEEELEACRSLLQDMVR